MTLDLLYIKTGRVTSLPDEEALRFVKEYPGQYKIIDCGFAPKEPVQLDKKTVAELIMTKEEEDDLQEQEEEKVQIKTATGKPIEKYSYQELRALCMKLNINAKGSKEVLLKRLQEEMDKE